MNIPTKQWYFALTLVLIAVLAAMVLPLLITAGLPLDIRNEPSVVLPTLIVSALMALMAALTIISLAFAAMNLSDHTQALGLPEGTVRSLIALSLILIFIIVALYLYGSLSSENSYESIAITQADLSLIPPENIVKLESQIAGDERVYNVTIAMPKSEASEDFAQQILTTAATLVVAVAGFYFGTRAVATARGVVELSTPLIHTLTPSESSPDKGEVDFTITGDDFQLPKQVKLVQSPKEIIGEAVLSNTTTITGKFKIGPETMGKWALIVVNEDGQEARLDDAFEVK